MLSVNSLGESVFHITSESIRTFLTRVAGEVDEDFAYKRQENTPPGICLYVHGPKLPIVTSPYESEEYDVDILDFEGAAPGCIVGKYLYEEAGIPLEVLFRWEDRGVCEVLEGLKEEGYLTYEPAASHLLRVAQFYQDNRVTWRKTCKNVLESEW